MTEPPFDPIAAEARELDLLIDRGLAFTTPKRSLFRLLGNPERSWIIQQPYLGTLDYLSREFVNMGFSEEAMRADPMNEAKTLVATNAVRCARVVAIAVLNSRWKIRLLSGLLSRYLLWHITPKKLFQLTLLINTMSNLGDFTNSIRYLHVSRTTNPNLIEKPTGTPDHREERPVA